ncbi:DMT family transporter [Vogesella sp. LIG4]|uniref:DMT family transporter n=1 Tax=Vogesella sp. LIG4 TaxID=1192162 RepID=UPI00081FE420|nr:DMT family transporter [Vogesella sp. LIG4]SCK28866.1 S-adenosylmethionine uptake transporter [Vogesella sp. LIG4]
MQQWFARLGSGWMVVAAVFFALMSFFAARLGGHFDSFEVLFYRTLVGFLLLLPGMLRNPRQLLTPHLGAHAKRSMMGYLSMAMLFYALTHLPLATAVTLNYTSSLSFAVCFVLLRGERLSPPVLLALLLGLAGISFILRPTFDAGQWLPGLIGLGSGLCAGLAVFHVRELGELGEAPSVIVFWFFLLASLFGLAIVLLRGGFALPDLPSLLQLLAVGLFGLGGQLAMTRAYKEGRKYLVSSLSYLTVVFSALLGVLFQGQTLAASALIGMALIVACGLLAIRGGR